MDRSALVGSINKAAVCCVSRSLSWNKSHTAMRTSCSLAQCQMADDL